MTYPTFTPPRTPVLNGSQVDTTANVREAKFQDAYAQRIPDGINTIVKSTTLFWTKLSLADATAIENTLAGYLGTQPFLYQIPGDFAVRQWVCKKWTMPLGDGVYYQMTANLEQDFSFG